MTAPVRVLLVDDHLVVRDGLRYLLGSDQGVEVVGEAASGEAGVAAASELRPDVVLMDLMMPGCGGIEAIVRMRHAGIDAAVLVLTTFAEEKQVRDALAAGAMGYLLKDLNREELLAAIHSAAVGQPTLHPQVQRQLIRTLLPQQPTPDPATSLLSPREREVLQLLGEGLSNKRIATKLGLTVGTVKGHVSAVLRKLDLADRTQAALYHARSSPATESRETV